MKSCIFHKKYLLAGIYIIFVLFTCCNSRFYHTPLAKICSVTEKQTLSREGTRGSKEYYYTQNITARILNGPHKGEKITVSNEYTSSQVQTKKYHKGDTVLLSGSKESPGKTIRSVKRDGYLALLAGGLFFLLICITGKQGFYTIISLILNTVIFAYGFQAFTEGKNILNICNVIAVLFSLTTLICLNGIHRKTFSSVLSTLCVLFLIMALFEFSIYMYGDLDYSNLEYLGSIGNSADIFWADIMLTLIAQTCLTLPTAKAGGFLLLPLLHWQTPYGTAMSYTVSTSYIYTVPVCPTVQFLSLCRLHLQSFFQNIDTCIRIPVMNRMAFGTLPDTNAQIFYPWISVATTAAGLTARIHRWYSVNFISIPASFIFQHFKKFCPGNTRYRF